jgi:hypothetical protein
VENNGKKEKNAEDNMEKDNVDNEGKNAEDNPENVEDDDNVDAPTQDIRLRFRPEEINHERTYSVFAYAAFVRRV